ncbi:MAG TPA: type II secretion system F family protein [Candidatus Limnocylindria bacterium]|nr:type II secretion system F family protein [Candidatus Limnocylindria bacterium]
MTALLLAISGAMLLLSVLDERRARACVAFAARLDPRARSAARDRRLAFPGLVDGLGAALASGLSVQLAFAEVAPTLPRALVAPTERAAASLALGASVDEAVGAYAGIVAGEDLAPLAVVLGAFARSGGRIGHSLDRVATLLRGRIALEDERSALTAQGRVSALVLVALAPLGAIFFALMTPEYLATMLDRGRWLVAVAVALELIGALWLWRILRLVSPAADLASLLDAVIVGLDAGLTFELALAALVRRAPQVARLPEARRLLADLALGRGTKQSFAAFGTSGPTEARVAALVTAATRFGSPLAGLLLTQADALRVADRRRAEAKARRLPVLMLFPLAFCVLPALLCVFLGPPLLSLLG